MILHLVRVMFLLVVTGIAVTLVLTPLSQPTTHPAGGDGNWGFLAVAAPIVVPVVAAFLLVLVDMFWRRKRLQVLSGLFFGALAGMIIAYGLSVVIDVVVRLYRIESPQNVQLAKSIVGVSVIFLCISFVLQTKDDFRFIVPYVEFSRQTRGAKPLLLDTSAIIDGRIADVVETGAIDSELVVARFVLTELQAVADSQDKLKRARGRRGLDILAQLQSSKRVGVRLLDPSVPAVEKAVDTDEKLVALARHMDGRVVTTDYNLNKIARLRGVGVLNINDLAGAMRPAYLPGEALRLKVVRPGESQGQGVGYLQDGTMVVVEQAKDLVGQDVDVTVTSAIQTSAGRMIFARRTGQPEAT